VSSGFRREIDLAALSHNFAVVKRFSSKRPVIAVVKADAYGHGAPGVAGLFSSLGASYLGVANTDEAAVLRDAGIRTPILVFFDPDVAEVFRLALTPVVFDVQSARALSREAERRNTPLRIHVKIDSGMGRLGLPAENAALQIREIANLPGIEVEGIMSHFADADLREPAFAEEQLMRFRRVRDDLASMRISPRCFHMANSAAVLSKPEAHFDAVRPGLMLYGYSPLEHDETAFEPFSLLPAMRCTTRFVSIRSVPAGVPISYGRTFYTKRQSIIGVLALGYADGFFRGYSNNGEVLVRGGRAPVVGRVCMDLTMVDVTDISGVDEDDEVVLIGTQGSESITAADWARRLDTIPYEVLLALGRQSVRSVAS